MELSLSLNIRQIDIKLLYILTQNRRTTVTLFEVEKNRDVPSYYDVEYKKWTMFELSIYRHLQSWMTVLGELKLFNKHWMWKRERPDLADGLPF